jgi:hypothetical protein
VDDATELEWLRYYYHASDFGPAHGDVVMIIREAFEQDKGKRVPKGYRDEENR